MKKKWTDSKINDIIKIINNEALFEKGSYLPKSHKILKTPYIIEINNSVIQRIKRLLHPTEEKGGFLRGRINLKTSPVTITITHVQFIPNRINQCPSKYKKPDKIYTRENAYWMNPKERDDGINASLIGTKRIRYLPFLFHTHPKVDIETEDKLFQIYAKSFNLSTSLEDQESLGTYFYFNEQPILLPSVLISTYHENLFLGFYGGGLPLDFDSIYRFIEDKGYADMESLIEENVESEGWKLVGELGIGFMRAFTDSMRYSNDETVRRWYLVQTANMFQRMKKENLFFTIVDNHDLVKITIPDFTQVKLKCNFNSS